MTMSSDSDAIATAEGLASPKEFALSNSGAPAGEVVAYGHEHEHEHEAAMTRDEGVPTDVIAGDNTAGGGEAGTMTADVDRVHNDEQVGSLLNGTVDDPTYPPSKALSLEDFFNPRNLTLDELEMVLYEWEEEGTSVKEYIDMRVINRLRTGDHDDDWTEKEEEEEEEEPKGWMSRLKKWATRDYGSNTTVDGDAADEESKTKDEFKGGPTKYLNLTDDAAHVVEFYAPWCPHCQNYKWEYIELAAEVQRRSISPVEFHAVSCDLHYAICATYEIGGFPAVLGWRQGESKAYAGLVLNNKWKVNADMVAEMLGLDLAHEAVEMYELDLDDETQSTHDLRMIEKAHKAATLKTSWHEHAPHTRNDRYHNAALSLAFAVKSQSFQTLTDDGKMDPKRKRALVDFLNLLDWASPQSWELRRGFVKELQSKVDADKVTDRGDMESLIDADMDRHRSSGSKDLWGVVDVRDSGWTGMIFGQKQEELAKDDKRWTKACTHSQSAKGFTCGLWNLFHILTIGSSKQEHELYGFHRGYFVSPHHVAETIRNFVAYFLSCDVCRDHFLQMYDDCGYDHCNRLKSEVSMGAADGSDPASMELALWLWEVHNSVNERLMKEAAQRQNREVTHEETLASKFPTKKLCSDCWLDANMTKWDNAIVFRFLDNWFWPNYETSDEQFKAVFAGTAEFEESLPADLDVRVGGSFSGRAVKTSSFASSRLGKGFTSPLFCYLLLLLFVACATQGKFREKRKRSNKDWGKKNP